VPKVRQHVGDFNALGITECDVGRLYGLFRAIDGDGSGSIEIIELLMFLDVERTRFTKRIFSMFDDDNSGSIDFREFVLSIWNYCTLGKTSLVVFAFDLYDQDKSGYVDIGEAQHLIKDVYGEKFNQNTHARRYSLLITRSHLFACD
jgi:Ca2+-binding EF-hand superfamily protein